MFTLSLKISSQFVKSARAVPEAKQFHAADLQYPEAHLLHLPVLSYESMHGPAEIGKVLQTPTLIGGLTTEVTVSAAAGCSIKALVELLTNSY